MPKVFWWWETKQGKIDFAYIFATMTLLQVQRYAERNKDWEMGKESKKSSIKADKKNIQWIATLDEVGAWNFDVQCQHQFLRQCFTIQ